MIPNSFLVTMDQETSFVQEEEEDFSCYRDPDPIKTERLIGEENDFRSDMEHTDFYDQQILEQVLQESLLQVNPYDARVKEERREMCKEVLRLLERTRRYVEEDELLYKIIMDFCDESGSLALEKDIFDQFHQLLLLFVEKKKMSQELATYLLINTDVQLH